MGLTVYNSSAVVLILKVWTIFHTFAVLGNFEHDTTIVSASGQFFLKIG